MACGNPLTETELDDLRKQFQTVVAIGTLEDRLEIMTVALVGNICDECRVKVLQVMHEVLEQSKHASNN